MKKDELIIERNIQEKIIVPKDRKEWLNRYLQEPQGSIELESQLPSVKEMLEKRERGNLSEVQLVVLDITKSILNPKRKVLIDTIAKNPGKNHADLLNMESIKKAGFTKKTLSVELKVLISNGIVRDDAKNEKTHPKHVYMCKNFDLLQKAKLI